MTHARVLLSEESKLEFAGLLIMHRLVSEGERIHSSFMESNDRLVEPYLDALEDKGLVQRGAEYYYEATEKGKQLYQKLIDQRLAYARHFGIYERVDLAAGTFADPQSDFQDDERWADLRVAVAEFKGVDPYHMVFLAMLSDEHFFENHDWRFDLGMGNLFEEMEKIVQDQISEDDLAYEDEEGLISGHDVLQDVILQGDQIFKKRFKAQQEREVRQTQEEIEEVTIIEDPGWLWR